MTGFKKEIIGLFLATTSSEDFQSYRLYNAVLYLQRNGVDLSTVFSLMILLLDLCCISLYRKD